MSADTFLDTNVIVYCFDETAPEKRERARKILAGPNWIVSWQVVQEFLNLALHRFRRPMEPADLQEFLERVLWPKCRVYPSLALHRSALVLSKQTQYRYYDSLIVASALSGGATTLYTEDLQNGRLIGSLTIRNPFEI